MAERDDILRGYADALFAVAEAEGELDTVESQLYAFARMLEQQARFREALVDPALPIENKRDLIRDAIGDRVNPIALNLLTFLVEQGRAREAGVIIDTLAHVVAERRQPRFARRYRLTRRSANACRMRCRRRRDVRSSSEWSSIRP